MDHSLGVGKGACQEGQVVSKELLKTAGKKGSKSKEERERYTQLNVEFQRTAREMRK